MQDVVGMLGRWGLDVRQVRTRIYRATDARERERWHALWLLGQGWPASRVAEALDRDAHTIGAWVAAFRAQGPHAGSSRRRSASGWRVAVASAICTDWGLCGSDRKSGC